MSGARGQVIIMIQTIKKTLQKIMQHKKQRNIAVLCISCVAVVGFFTWFFIGNRNPVGSESILDAISAGDVVVISVFADEMYDVYGYQFDMYYNRDYLEYSKRLTSDIDGISTIFATEKERYLLVGATMIGEVDGHSGQEVPVCHVEFVALADYEPNADISLVHTAISNVNIVTGDLQYMENVEGWTTSMTVR